MRENRTSGSEGGGAGNLTGPSYPIYFSVQRSGKIRGQASTLDIQSLAISFQLRPLLALSDSGSGRDLFLR